MSLPRTVLALFSATALNGSVALAMTQPACIGPAHQVCALPLDAVMHPASLTETVSYTQPETQTEALAPPARPADLLSRHARAAAAAATVAPRPRPFASFAPPSRPVHLWQAAGARL